MIKSFTVAVAACAALFTASAHAADAKPSWAFACSNVIVGYKNGKPFGIVYGSGGQARLKVKVKREKSEANALRFSYKGTIKRKSTERGYPIVTKYHHTGTLVLNATSPHQSRFLAKKEVTEICEDSWFGECMSFSFGTDSGTVECEAHDVPAEARAGH